MAPSKNKSPVEVDIGARAEAKLEIKTTIPEKSAGRLVDSLTDLIRPFCESRGLKADQIRLQREEVAIEIAKKARRRLEIEEIEIHPVPNKILVPLIESASCEDIDDSYMTDMWANLLASAASKSNVEPRYVNILRELSGKQARMLEKIAYNHIGEFEDKNLFERLLLDAPFDLDFSRVSESLEALFSGKDFPRHLMEVYDRVQPLIDRPGSLILDYIVGSSRGIWRNTEDSHDHEEVCSLEILTSIGLCRRVKEEFTKHSWDIFFWYYYISELGIYFLNSCYKNWLDQDRQPKS